MAYPETRPNGDPAATSITPAVRGWLCRGGLDPDRVLRLPGFTEGMLLAMWNARVDARECEFATPDDRAAHPAAPRA